MALGLLLGAPDQALPEDLVVQTLDGAGSVVITNIPTSDAGADQGAPEPAAEAAPAKDTPGTTSLEEEQTQAPSPAPPGPDATETAGSQAVNEHHGADAQVVAQDPPPPGPVTQDMQHDEAGAFSEDFDAVAVMQSVAIDVDTDLHPGDVPPPEEPVETAVLDLDPDVYLEAVPLPEAPFQRVEPELGTDVLVEAVPLSEELIDLAPLLRTER